jgi:hypothetical protein
MKRGGKGGSKASTSGSAYESATDDLLIASLESEGWFIKGELDAQKASKTFFMLESKHGNKIEIFYKRGIYRNFFAPRGVNYEDYFSARLEPDTAIFSESTNVLTVIEKKQQTKGGSVAEKLQTCHFKRKYYETLCKQIGVEVDLVWILGKHFQDNQDSLESVFDYMNENGSRYYFDSIPVSKLRLI